MCLLFPSGLINTFIPHNQAHAQRIFGGTLVVYIVERENFRDDISSVQFSRSVMSDSLRPHESQHARPP